MTIPSYGTPRLLPLGDSAWTVELARHIDPAIHSRVMALEALVDEARRHDPVFAGWFPFNGNGEMTGTIWVEESGMLEGPVMITNTHSVGVVRDAVIEWYMKKLKSSDYSGDISLPVVAETYDGSLNDINGFHVNLVFGDMHDQPRASSYDEFCPRFPIFRHECFIQDSDCRVT